MLHSHWNMNHDVSNSGPRHSAHKFLRQGDSVVPHTSQAPQVMPQIQQKGLSQFAHVGTPDIALWSPPSHTRSSCRSTQLRRQSILAHKTSRVFKQTISQLGKLASDQAEWDTSAEDRLWFDEMTLVPQIFHFCALCLLIGREKVQHPIKPNILRTASIVHTIMDQWETKCQ